MLADVLTRSRISRLTKALVYDKQSAAIRRQLSRARTRTPASSTSSSRRGRRTRSPSSRRTSIRSSRRSSATGRRTTRSDRSKASLQLGFLAGLESNLGKAQRLAIGQAFHNDPNRAFAVDYAKYQAVTAADVKRVANKYLGKGRVVLSIVPIGKSDQASKPAASITVTQMTSGTNAGRVEAK